MLQVPLSAAYFQGAASVQPHPGGGLQPWRLPHTAHHLYPSPNDGLLVKASHGSGVRLHFTSDTTAIELEYDPLTPVDPNNKEMSPHSFDVTTGSGEIVANALAAGSSTRIELPPPTDGVPRTLEVWLPQASDIVLRSMWIDAGTTALIEPDPRPVWVTYGSSLTHCTRANSPACTWPALVARKYGLHLISLGFGGDCHLEPMLGFHIRDLGADYITMKLGINTLNTLGPRTFPVRRRRIMIVHAKPAAHICAVGAISNWLIHRLHGALAGASYGSDSYHSRGMPRHPAYCNFAHVLPTECE